MEEMINNPDLEVVFQEPFAAKAIVEGLPLLQAIHGVDELVAKGDNFAPEDVSQW